MLEGRTPLGWLQLTHSRARFTVAACGVGFAVVLVFMQLGFMNMLFDATTTLHGKFDADIFILNKEDARQIDQSGSLSVRRLVQAMGVDGVADGEGLYVGTVNWTKPSDGETGNLFVMAINPSFDAFKDPEVSAQMRKLNVPGTFLFDRGSRGDYSAFIAAIDAETYPTAEIADVTGTAVGHFSFGVSFGIEAEAIISSDTFLAMQPSRDPDVINIGLVQVEQGQDPQVVAERINRVLAAEDAYAVTVADFKQVTRSFLRDNSPIAYIFSFGVAVGLIVGAIIVIQILSSDVQDHMGEYATFKAIGFTNRYLLGIVYEQSAILTVVGFVPGLGLSLLLYDVVGGAVAMAMTMPLQRVGLVFGLTALMCIGAGTIAMRRVYSADPAEVF